jgi:hypothetical protein
MSHEFCQTEDPYYILVKEYETKPSMEDLTEMFIVIYVLDLPNWQIKEETDGVEYVFFTSLEKAFKRFKAEGPRRALLKRIFTDNEELIELAKINDNLVVPESPDNDEIVEQTTEHILKPISIPPKDEVVDE